MSAAKTALQFVHGQHIYTALRALLGVVLPALCALAISGSMEAAIGLALGAFCVSLNDLPETLRRKPRRMLAATLVLASAATAIAPVLSHPAAALPALLAIVFCAGLAVAYGQAGTLLGMCALLGVDLMLAQHDAGGDPWVFLAWMVAGGLWYTAFSTAVCAVFSQQIARRAIGESLMAAAAHLRCRAECFVPGTPLDQCQRRLADAQSVAIDAQQTARDIVLGGLAANRRHDSRQAHLFNMLTGAVDVHDISLALHDDFTALRGGGDGRTGRAVHDIILGMARWIEDLVPRYVLGRTVDPPATLDRAARELDDGPAQVFKARLAMLAGTLVQLAAEADAAARAHGTGPRGAPDTAWPSDVALAVRTWRATQNPRMPWHALRASPAAVRHAVRLTAAIAAGTLAAKWVGGHGTWVILTIMIVMNPAFGANQQRTRQRIAGTLLGCLGTAVLLWLGVQAPWLVTVAIILAYGASFALARPATYLASVVFTTIAVLMLYHLLVPGWSMIEQRGVDTLIGGTIGALGAFLFPAWEYVGLDTRLAAARQACRGYAAAVFSDDFQMPCYRLARREALQAVRTLAASYQRMLQEPVSKRHAAMEIGMWLAACNLMIAALAALGQWRRANAGVALSPDCRVHAPLVDRTLDGATDEAGDAGQHAPAALMPLIGAARAMRRANVRLASASRRPASRRMHA
ncbi:FUSC family protein [Bordetella bronchialis]|uniref:Uncharacterized protein n=1 Tax=Bordetella bronchialis TaxID=463025 RepID=A0A193FV23_9BORD|nr:FUSC family membrane protein [Bordetella bronchialis]ANN71607.1 hypothetical protein BAU08_09895 [Bordetella bronchialis]